MQGWCPDSWQSKSATQQPVYQDRDALAAVVEQISLLPPLVTSWEVEGLKGQLAEASRGERFILQGGDCAESFDQCNAPYITNKLKILLQMSLVLVRACKKRVTRIGRVAGQYAKPRSEDFETREGVTLPAYRGDLVNRPGFSEADRIPDPALLLRAYERAALTLNFIRALVKGGFADLHHTEYWDLDFADHSPLAEDYRRMAREVSESMEFTENVLGVKVAEMNWVDFFTGHEGLLLLYEQAQTRRVPRRPGWYNLSTHFPWIGMRTADPDGAHVEYFRGIENPIGIKIGPGCAAATLRRLLDALHPRNEPGRLTLIHRFGAAEIEQGLPPMIEAVRASGKQVVWVCDAMHGNTRKTSTGIKTRDFTEILRELELAFDIHAACGSQLHGAHFELTGENVTECVGGARGLIEADLSRAYKSQVDPRLNHEQALEMAMLMARKIIRTNSQAESAH